MHIAVLILFGLAITCYLSQWLDAALAFGVLGVLFEIAAWITWFVTEAERKAADASPGSQTTRDAN
jgi:hypothetical protein